MDLALQKIATAKGRVIQIRRSGKNLLFADVLQDSISGSVSQVLFSGKNFATDQSFRLFDTLRRGDIIGKDELIERGIRSREKNYCR